MQLPQRVQDQLQAAEALEAADQVARAQAPTRVSSVADLVAPIPAPVAVAAPQPAAPAPAPAAPKDDFEHKYRVLQGMYEADVKQVKAELRDLKAAQSARAQEPAPLPVADPRDVEAFGNDMMDMVQRYVTGAVNTLEARIQNVEAQLGSVTQETALTKEQQFYALLGQLVPSWRAVNDTDAWLQWLGVKDEVYGLPRQAALDNAFNRLDAQQVAKVFNAYVSSVPAAPAPASMENQITPDGAGSSAPQVEAAKPILSERAITAFYNDKARGAYRGREAEADTLEAQIDTAVAEGRVGR